MRAVSRPVLFDQNEGIPNLRIEGIPMKFSSVEWNSNLGISGVAHFSCPRVRFFGCGQVLGVPVIACSPPRGDCLITPTADYFIYGTATRWKLPWKSLGLGAPLGCHRKWHEMTMIYSRRFATATARTASFSSTAIVLFYCRRSATRTPVRPPRFERCCSHTFATARNCQWCRPLRPKTSESTDCRKKKREEFDSHV